MQSCCVELSRRNLFNLSCIWLDVLSGCSYEVLSSHVKENSVKATEALQERLNPVKREALVSAQLMRHKQQPNDSVDEFAQDLEKLFEHSYGRRKGMDESSKEVLKRDILCKVCGCIGRRKSYNQPRHP